MSKIINFFKNVLKYMKLNPVVFVVIAAILPLVFLLALDQIKVKKLENELREQRNENAQLLGTQLIDDGVYLTLAEENDRLHRRYDEVLGENERMSNVINKREEEVRLLANINASLRDTIRMNGSASTTVIRNSGENNDTTTTVIENGSDEVESLIPNLRVDFDLENSGFRVFGHTTTNPSYAELDLEQTEPFNIHLAVTENEDGVWAAYIYDTNDRLEFNISDLEVDSNNNRYRWYERIGVGSDINMNIENGIGVSPNVSLSLGRRMNVDVSAGPYYNDSWGGQVGVNWRPFMRSRN